jgi:hypothetical protein
MPWGEEFTGTTLVGMYLVELAVHGFIVAAATVLVQLLSQGRYSAHRASCPFPILFIHGGHEALLNLGPITRSV